MIRPYQIAEARPDSSGAFTRYLVELRPGLWSLTVEHHDEGEDGGAAAWLREIL